MIGTKLIKHCNRVRRNRGICPVLLGCCAVFLLGACENQSFLDKLPSLGGGGELAESTSHMEPEEISSTSASASNPNPNPKNLFGNSLRSDEERLARLERAVQNMRSEFDNVAPSIRRLMAIEGDIQNLITELRKLTAEPELLTAPRPSAVAPPPASTPQVLGSTAQPKKVPPAQKAHKAKKPPAPKSYTKKTPPPVSGGKASIYDVRIGEHPGKTRIVLDTNAKTNFTTDIDNGENILIIELPQTSWSASTSKSLAKSNFIQSYNVETSGEDSLLIVQLKHNARVGYKDDLPGSNGGRRIVVDIEGS
ncbi:MAG: hypothetical protein MRY79_07440 [Alphaproteobacteria bacterium]|nr:hypothetical protein [Alphaproteobacteria bacterium]